MKKELIFEENSYINEKVEISKISPFTMQGETHEPIWIKKGAIELKCLDCSYHGKLVQGGIYQTAIYISSGCIFNESTGILENIEILEESAVLFNKSIEILEKSTIYFDTKPEPKVEKLDQSYGYDLYGIVKDGIFHLGEFQFLFYRFEEYERWYKEDDIYTEEPYIKWRVDKIIPEFLKRIDVGIQNPVFSWKKLWWE